MKILFLCHMPDREGKWLQELNYLENVALSVMVFSNLDYFLLKNEVKLGEFKNVINYTFEVKNKYAKYKNKTERELKIEIDLYSEKYRIDYNFIMIADRFLKKKSKLEQYKLLLVLTEYLNENFFENKYDKIVGELASSFNLIAYYLCQSKFLNTKYLFFWHGRLKNKIAIENLEGERIGLKEKYMEFLNREFTVDEKLQLENYYKELIEEDVPVYEKFNRKGENIFYWLKSYGKNKIIKFYYEIITYLIDRKALLRPKTIREKIIGIQNIIFYNLKKKINEELFETPDLNKNFLIFPLHYQPEVTTLVFAQEYLDQLKLINDIAEKIPNNMYLYVKEHPSMFKSRNVNEYKKIKNKSNIKLISPFFSMKKILKKSKGIITLTGTVGYEGILEDKPVYTFGKVFYNVYSNVFNVRSVDELCQRIKMKKIFIKKEKDAFILANLKTLKEGNYNNHLLDKSVTSIENSKKIAKLIYECRL